MLLVSYTFLAFLAVLFAAYYLIPGRFQWILLLAASCLFYLSGGVPYLLYPLITMATTWFLARRIGRLQDIAKAYIKERKPDKEEKAVYQRQMKQKQRRLMIAGLLLNFGILAILKYTGFFLDNLALLLPLGRKSFHVNWILPLGISYYTFQSMGYLVDVYRGRCRPEQKPGRFALFVLYFPQIVSGPISRFDQLKDELFAAHRFDSVQMTMGLWRILWGFFKKLVIADRLSPAVAAITAAPGTYRGVYALLGMLGYTLQLYTDFSGCMDIVIGVSQCLGIRLPENFQRPFGARSLSELWRRWHMTLTQWFKDYIFFPVSSSRFCRKLSELSGKLGAGKLSKKIPVYTANLLVWLVTGIWHGASWNFVLWGLANGVVMMISQECSGLYRRFHRRFPALNGKAYDVFQKIRTGLLFSVLLMFQYESLGTVFSMLWSMIADFRISQLWDGRFAALGLMPADLVVLALAAALLLIVSILQESGSVRKRLLACPAAVRYGAVFVLFTVVLVTGSYGHGYDASQFIYNRF